VFLYFSFYFSKKIYNDFIKFIFSDRPCQIAIIVVLVLLFFGGKKIPELMKGLGSGIKEFKKGVKEEDSIEESKKEE
tara:strand:+ start:378 stop:608 length:231 start_codon:yes stop_codon:yes gene_type:complete